MVFKKETISRAGYEGEYLTRWHLLKAFFFKVYLHCFRGPDRDEFHHDHPWNSLIIILKGGYSESILDTKTGKPKKIIERKAGSIRFMRAEVAHKVLKLHSNKVWTLFIPLKKHKEWGFYTDNGWVHFREYLETCDLSEEREC